MTIRSRRLLWLLALAACCVIAIIGRSQLQAIFATRPSENMPAYRPVEVSFGKQNWSPEQRAWFYHTAQGTVLLPYKWFLALEQPEVKLFATVPKFADAAYLARFGFLPDAASLQNPDGLPVGFAKDTVVDPTSGQTVEVLGLTCAACHTGQVEYRGRGIRIDGGSATIDLASFQTELGYAVGFTNRVPFRFNRFARVVLGKNASDADKRKLRQDLRGLLNAGKAENDAAVAGKLY